MLLKCSAIHKNDLLDCFEELLMELPYLTFVAHLICVGDVKEALKHFQELNLILM